MHKSHVSMRSCAQQLDVDELRKDCEFGREHRSVLINIRNIVIPKYVAASCSIVVGVESCELFALTRLAHSLPFLPEYQPLERFQARHSKNQNARESRHEKAQANDKCVVLQATCEIRLVCSLVRHYSLEQ